jgi:hypothetical protein
MDGGFCIACGAQVPEGASFCGACGTAVQAAAPAEAAVAPPAVVTPAEAAIPAQPATASPAAMPPAAAAPAYAPPPAPASNPPWGKILSVLAGVGLLIFAGFKLYDAFFGAPISSSAVRQMEDQIRRDFQARGQQVSQIQLTAESRDRMVGSATVGNATIPGQGARYNCSATRQSGSYFAYTCEPASGTAGTAASMMPTPSSLAPTGMPAAYGAPAPTAMTAERRAHLLAECTSEYAPSLCACAVDRLAAGTPARQAMQECAAQLGMPPPRGLR